mmetsp:Transcript_37278/g.96613  ORF Transcript_37278/g.96613 Transcript_37278/m.96613 type:complete len:127 (+) Transcript_37278:109-489(+)
MASLKRRNEHVGECQLGEDGWIDLRHLRRSTKVEKFAQCLPHLRYLRELNLTNNEITELGAGDLAESVPLCKSLKKLFLTENEIHPGLEGSERLRETWKAAGKNEFWLFLWYPELSDYVKRKIATS